jgi:hypothetical protein
MQKIFKRKVRIVRKRGRSPGRIEIDFYDDRDLNTLIKILMDSADTFMRANLQAPRRDSN